MDSQCCLHVSSKGATLSMERSPYFISKDWLMRGMFPSPMERCDEYPGKGSSKFMLDNILLKKVRTGLEEKGGFRYDPYKSDNLPLGRIMDELLTTRFKHFQTCKDIESSIVGE
ncbi:hypothetical protein Tco_0454282 [Tanacetum coccineum]